MSKLYAYNDEVEKKVDEFCRLRGRGEDEAKTWIEENLGEEAYERLENSTVLEVFLEIICYLYWMDPGEAMEVLMTPICLVNIDQLDELVDAVKSVCVMFSRNDD